MTSRARARQSCYSKLFRGREDVYGIRKRFKSDEWGYVPSTIRHWKAVLSADAALRKKVDQKTRKWLPLTDEVLRQHLEGKQAVFIRCSWTKPAGFWFLAVDCDKKSWREDATAFLETCRELGVSAAVER
jgi:hypothetical protein